MHAVETFPEECCGLVIGGEYVPCKNVHPDPFQQFEIDLQTFAIEDIQGVAHSHPFVLPHPTKLDMEQQMLWDVPWAIASITANKDPFVMDLFWYGDTLERLPLVGRPFRPGVQDCFALARDYYFIEHGITIPDFPRNDRWWMRYADHEPENLFVTHLEESGFQIIDPIDVRPGDGFACPVATSVVCHCGVILPGNKVLHHFSNRLSEIVPAEKWLRRTVEGGKFFRVLT